MRKALTAVVMAALAGVAATASPAAAALPSAVAGLSCAPGTAVSQTFAGSSQSSTARGQIEARATSLVGDSEITGKPPKTSASFGATIPVYFHVLAKSRAASDGWVTDRQIRDQIAVMNAAFAGQYGGADTGFRFVLRGTTRTINARWHDMETLSDELEAKRALKVGGATTLNIYSTSISLGFAYLPKIVTSPRDLHPADGVVIHFGSMPGGHIRNFNLGHTGTHEAGHWLGLEHTFEQGCRGHGDFVDDTPAMSVPTSGCPAGKDTCPEPGLDPIHNYMDYSWDTCYSEFTRGQATRMQQQYLHWRVEHGYSPAR